MPTADRSSADYVLDDLSRIRARLLDTLVVLALIAISIPIRWNATRGDFWLDEADYALASVRGFDANRWDESEQSDPDKLVRLRHFHPPLVAHVIGLASNWSLEDRSLRVPSVIAGALTVALVYLCGLYLFASRGGPPSFWIPRTIALACAAVIITSPAHVRASSHALPWAFITLGLVALALTLSAYGHTRRPGWLVALGGALGLLFATSEYVAVAALAVGLSLPFLLWTEIEGVDRLKPTLIGVLGGLALLFAVAYILWPAGITGGLPRMLEHYMDMAHDPWPVVIGGQPYQQAPKWAYVYWYRTFYPAYAAWYAVGILGLAALAITRRLTAGIGAVAILTAIVLFAAHKSHIIGPEYLVHALPLMTLLGGLFFSVAAEYSAAAACVMALAGSVAVCFSPVNTTLSGMERRATISRWPAAARYLKAHWGRDTRMLAPAYGGVGRWYVMYGAGVRREEWRVQALPAAGVSDEFLRQLENGAYDYVAVGSTFADWADVDPRVRRQISSWPIVWRSSEYGTGLSRLIIYQHPSGRRSWRR